MTKEQRYPKWARLQEKYAQQLQKLEAAKKIRQEKTNFTTSQAHIRRLTQIANR